MYCNSWLIDWYFCPVLSHFLHCNAGLLVVVMWYCLNLPSYCSVCLVQLDISTSINFRFNQWHNRQCCRSEDMLSFYAINLNVVGLFVDWSFKFLKMFNLCIYLWWTLPIWINESDINIQQLICVNWEQKEKGDAKNGKTNLAWERTEMEWVLKNPVTSEASIGCNFAWLWLWPLI